MRSKLIAAGVSVAALLLPASAMAQGGGSGQAQFNTQEATTLQAALSHADANQNGVNTNAPVNVAGGDVRSGDNSANQNLSNDANSTASNDASTTQNSDQSQSASSPARRTGPAAPANSKRMAKRRSPVSWRPPARAPTRTE